MVLITSKMLLTVGLKTISPALKLIKSKLQKELYIYKILRSKGAISITPDFESIYLETLYQQIAVKRKNKNIVALFELEEVKKAFEEEIYDKNNWTFKVKLDDNLHTNPKLRKLKYLNVNLGEEIEEFKIEFKNVTNSSRNPKEVEQFEAIKKIQKDVNSLIDTQVLKKKFNSDVEISNLILFSNSTIQPLSEHISKRKVLVDTFLKRFRESGWLAIDGSISTGKTQISVLLSQKISSTIYWINLREYNSKDFLAKVLIDLSSFLSIPHIDEINEWFSSIFNKIEQGSVIVLDDLPQLEYRSQAFNRFITFINNCKQKGVSILSTSNFELPSQITEYIDDDFIDRTKIPFLQEDDVLEILLTYKITIEKANALKRIIHTTSSGHPIIIKAICNYLIRKEWVLSENELTAIFKGNYALDIKEDTYKILSNTVPDEDTRNLLYRLNSIIGSFTIDDVRLVGNCSPVIPNIVERFTKTMGLWIQKRDSEKYDISPLLKALKSNDLTYDLEKEVNYVLGKSILNKKKLNQFDAQKAISYFVTAKSFNDAGFVLTLVLNEAIKKPDLAFESGIGYYWLSLPLPEEMDLLLKLYIRTLQILLAKHKEKYLSYLIEDLEGICSLASKKGVNAAPAYLLLSVQYSRIDPKKSLRYLMLGNDQSSSLIDTYGKSEALNLKEYFESILWLPSTSISSIEDFDNWFYTVEQVPEEKLDSFRQSEFNIAGSIGIFKNIKENEEKKPLKDQNWNAILEQFKHIQGRAKSLKIELLFANAIRYIIILYSENLNNIDEALKYAEKYLGQLSEDTSKFLVNDAIGRQLFYKNKIEKATPFVATAASINVDKFYTEKLDTYLVISQILGKKDTKVALHYSLLAYDFAIDNEFTSDIFKSKIIGELAISYFLDNKIKEAIYELEKGYEILLDSYNISNEFHYAILRYGHVLNYWYHLFFKGTPPPKDMLGGDYEIPTRGMFLKMFNGELVEEYYFSERRFIVSLLFLKSFEDFGDLNLSQKWAYNNIKISNSIDFNHLSLMLTSSLPYLLIGNKTTDAVNLQKKIIDDTNKLHSDKDNIQNRIKNNYLRNMIAVAPHAVKQEYDYSIVEFILIPMLFKYLTPIAYKPSDIKQHTKELEELLLVIEKQISNKDTIEAIHKILVIISEGEKISENIWRMSQEIKGEYELDIRLICYIFLSFFCNSHAALNYHFAIVSRIENTLQKISTGTFNFIVIPFFENFWFKRIETDSRTDIDFWFGKSKPYYNNTKMVNKFKCLFKIISHHFDYDTSIKEDEWLEY